MTLTRATVMKAEHVQSASTVNLSARDLLATHDARTTTNRATVISRVVMEARIEAEKRVHDAVNAAQAILTAAHAEAQTIRERSANEARAEQMTLFAAKFVALRHQDEARQTRDLDKTLALAVLLAERLIGETLPLQPARIRLLAEGALAAARGARKGTLDAHPEDGAALREQLGEGVLAAFTIRENPELSRGSLLVHTDVGSLDARLSVQLARLAETLREALRHG